MPSFNVPTDNLYKFIALTGLVLSFSSATLFFTRAEDLELKLIDAEFNRELLTLRAEDLKEEADELGKRADILSLESARGELEGTRAEVLKLKQASAQLSEENLRVLFESKKLVFWLQQLKIAKSAYLVGFPLGVSLMYLGFLLWYSKSQKYQDKLLVRNSLDKHHGG